MRAVCLICVVGTAFFLSSVECMHPGLKNAYKEKIRQDEATVEDDPEQIAAEQITLEPTANDTRSGISSTNDTCPACVMTELLRKFRLEVIKEKILAKLGMKHPPNITRPFPKIPFQLERVFELQRDEPDPYEADSFHATIEKLITFASKRPTINVKSETGAQVEQSSFYFNISQKVKDTHVVRAHLWVYIKPAEVVQDTATWVHIYQVWNPDGKTQHKKLVREKKIELNSRGGRWEQFDFKHIVHEWFTDPRSNLEITVEATDHEERSVIVTDSTDDQGGRPFLEITTQQHIRKKRSTVGMTCNEDTADERCCRYPLTVDFEEFGWDWIIAPKVYRANYCAGDCPVNFLPQYAHTYLVGEADPSGTVGPCCTATHVSAITMLYFNDTQDIVFGKLPNMVVDSCGCS